MKVEDILNTLTTQDKVVIYEMWQGDTRMYVDIFYEGANGFDMGLDENVLQREVTILTIYENTLFIVTDGDEDET